MTPDPDTHSPAGQTAYALALHHSPQLELAALAEASAGVIGPGSGRPAGRDTPAGQGSYLRPHRRIRPTRRGWVAIFLSPQSLRSVAAEGRPTGRTVPSPPAAGADPHALARRAWQPSGPSARGDTGVGTASGREKGRRGLFPGLWTPFWVVLGSGGEPFASRWGWVNGASADPLRCWACLSKSR